LRSPLAGGSRVEQEVAGSSKVEQGVAGSSRVLLDTLATRFLDSVFVGVAGGGRVEQGNI